MFLSPCKSNYIWQVLKRFLIDKERCENDNIATPEENDNADLKKKKQQNVFFTLILTETFVPMTDSVLRSLDSTSSQLEATLLRLRTSFGLLISLELYDGKGANCSRKFSRGCLLFLQNSSCSQKYISPPLSPIWGSTQKTAFSISPAVYLKINSSRWKNYIIFFFHDFVQLRMLHTLQLFIICTVKAAVKTWTTDYSVTHGLQRTQNEETISEHDSFPF